jgi:hypothetical protein
MAIIGNGFCVNVSFDLPRSKVSLIKHRAIVRLVVDSLDGLNDVVNDLRVDYPDAELVSVVVK